MLLYNMMSSITVISIHLPLFMLHDYHFSKSFVKNFWHKYRFDPGPFGIVFSYDPTIFMANKKVNVANVRLEYSFVKVAATPELHYQHCYNMLL